MTPWRTKLNALEDEGLLRRSDIDADTMQAIEGPSNHSHSSYPHHPIPDLDDDLADTVMARFAEVNFSRVGNLSGFLMGIVRRVQQDGPERGSRHLDNLPSIIRHRLYDLIDAVRPPVQSTEFQKFDCL